MTEKVRPSKIYMRGNNIGIILAKERMPCIHQQKWWKAFQRTHCEKWLKVEKKIIPNGNVMELPSKCIGGKENCL